MQNIIMRMIQAAKSPTLESEIAVQAERQKEGLKEWKEL